MTATGKQAFRWDAVNGMVALNGFPDGAQQSEPRSISNSGKVVGYAFGPSVDRAVYWDATGAITNLGPSYAYGVNDFDVIAGGIATAAIWDESGPRDLGLLSDRVTSFWGINDFNTAVGYVAQGGSTNQLLWSESTGYVDLGI
jgi:uncharacterized membrane protein